MDESKTNSTPLPDAPIPANIVTLLSEFKTLATMDIAEEEVIKISEQLLLQKDANWGDLLSAAPRTLCSIAQCFAIAWSEGADKFAQDKDNTMPKHLRTNLVDCSDLGRETFREAESKMNRVSTTIRNIVEFDGVIDKILDILGEENPKTSELSEKFMKLERLAKECVVDTDAVVQRSKTWEIKVSKVTTAYASTNARKSVPAKVGVFVMRRTPSFKITNVWPPRLSFSWNRELHQAQQKVGILNPPKREQPNTIKDLSVTEAQQAINSFERKELEGQRKFAMIERELRDMRSEEKATQDRVSKILQDCQENLAELRKDTEHLHGYFEVLYCLVKYITKQPGPNGIASSEELTKEQITDLNADITKLCVHYTIAGEISSTFVNVSRDFIMPGVDRVDSLSKTSARAEKSNISGIIQKIADYSNMAQEKIHDLAAMRRENLRKRLLDTERKFEEVGDKVLTLGSEQGKE